jgi:hypothetical protein
MTIDETIEKLQEVCDKLNLPYSLNWDFENNGQIIIYTDAFMKNGELVSSDLLNCEDSKE